MTIEEEKQFVEMRAFGCKRNIRQHHPKYRKGRLTRIQTIRRSPASDANQRTTFTITHAKP